MRARQWLWLSIRLLFNVFYVAVPTDRPWLLRKCFICSPSKKAASLETLTNCFVLVLSHVCLSLCVWVIFLLSVYLIHMKNIRKDRRPPILSSPSTTSLRFFLFFSLSRMYACDYLLKALTIPCNLRATVRSLARTKPTNPNNSATYKKNRTKRAQNLWRWRVSEKTLTRLWRQKRSTSREYTHSNIWPMWVLLLLLLLLVCSLSFVSFRSNLTTA